MDFDKYPRVKRFFEEHPTWTLDQALKWSEKQLEGEGKNDSENY